MSTFNVPFTLAPAQPVDIAYLEHWIAQWHAHPESKQLGIPGQSVMLMYYPDGTACRLSFEQLNKRSWGFGKLIQSAPPNLFALDPPYEIFVMEVR